MRHCVHLVVHQLQNLAGHSFWTVWLVLTGILLACTALFLRSPAEISPLQMAHSRKATGASILLFLFLAGYIAVILAGEDFAAYDNSQFTAYSLRGLDFPVWIMPQGGRFYPLALQQFNLIGLITRSIAGYHSFQIAQMLVLAAILLILDGRLSISTRAALLVVALTVPGVVISFTGLIYQESDVLFWLAWLALSVKCFSRTRSIGWGLAAVLSAQFALYYKEPVVIFLLAFSAVRLLLRARASNRIREVLRNPETRLDLVIGASALLFAAWYATVIFPFTTMQYLTSRYLSATDILREYLQSDWLVWIFSAFTVRRMYRVLRGASAPEPLWDGLACGALAYFAAYLAMRMASDYFLAPVDLIAVLYLGRFLCLSWSGMQAPLRVAVAVMGLLIVCQNLDFSAFHVLQRKWIIREKQRIAGAILDRYRSDPQHPVKLNFPVSSPYNMAEFAAYLNYRGLTVDEVPSRSKQSPHVELYGASLALNGPCVPWLTFVCHAGLEVAAAVTIVLPEDALSPLGFKRYQEAEQQLLAPESTSQPSDLLFRAMQFFHPVSGSR